MKDKKAIKGFSKKINQRKIKFLGSMKGSEISVNCNYDISKNQFILAIINEEKARKRYSKRRIRIFGSFKSRGKGFRCRKAV